MRVQPLHPPFYLEMLSAAYYAKGEFESTVTTSRQALELNPGDVESRIFLAGAYIGLDRRDLAQEEGAEIKRIEPSFSILRFANAQPYRDQNMVQRIASDLRLAGLPE